MAGRLNRGDVHLCRLSPTDKLRPVLVLTRDSALPHLSTVTVAAITSTIRSVPSEVFLDVDDGMKHPCAVNLYNTVTIAQSKVGPRIGSLTADRMHQVCSVLAFVLGCD